MYGTVALWTEKHVEVGVVVARLVLGYTEGVNTQLHGNRGHVT